MNTEPFAKIQPLQSAAVLNTRNVSQGESSDEPGVFADIFQTAIDNVKTTDAEKSKAQYLMATGQLDNPAELTIAATKAQLSVDLLVQLRNKALDAYSELTRINI